MRIILLTLFITLLLSQETIQDKDAIYEEALKQLEEDPSQLDEILKELGIDLDEINNKEEVIDDAPFKIFSDSDNSQSIFTDEVPDPSDTFLFTNFLTSMVSALEQMENSSDGDFLAKQTDYAPMTTDIPDEDDFNVFSSLFAPFIGIFDGFPSDGEFVEIETTTIDGVSQTRVSRSVSKNGITTTTTEITTNDPFNNSQKISNDFQLSEKIDQVLQQQEDKHQYIQDVDQLEVVPVIEDVQINLDEQATIENERENEQIIQQEFVQEISGNNEIQQEFIEKNQQVEQKPIQTVKVTQTKKSNNGLMLFGCCSLGMLLVGLAAYNLKSRKPDNKYQ